MEMGIPHDIVAKFIFVGPAGMPANIRESLADAIGGVINDKNTKASKFVTSRYGGPDVLTGKKLDGVPTNGPLKIVPSGPVNFANVYVRDLARR